MDALAAWQESSRPGEEREIVDECHLVEAALTDRTAFATLYERYADRVFGYFLRRAGHREDAEDLTSLTFARALGKLRAFRGRSFGAWLFGIARNAAIDHSRRRSTIPLAHTAEALPDPQPEPLAHILAGEDVALVQRLIARLSEEERELLALRVAGRLSNAEIAQVVGKSEDAVKMRLYRTIKLLRERYLAATGEIREVDR